jgi:hypothetical protein
VFVGFGGAPIDFSTPHYFAVSAGFSLASTYALLSLIRHFGFAAISSAFLCQLLVAPSFLGSWYAGYSLVALLIPVVIAAGALWVILSDARTSSVRLQADLA